MPLSRDEFTQQLTASGLLDAASSAESLSSLPPDKQPADGEALARELVRQKRLTKFQAEQLYAGKGNSLTLGNYVILDKLGQGGMGVVLKAQHKRMKRLVALKVMSPAAVKTPDALKRFHREVEAAAKLRHPNIVAADDADEAKGTHFLVMEYVNGSDLSALVAKMILIPPGEFMMGCTEAEIVAVLEQAGEFAKQSWFTDSVRHEAPARRVRLTKPFYVGVHEVTEAQFAQFVKASGYRTVAETDGKGGKVWDRDKLDFVFRKDVNWSNPGYEPHTPAYPVCQVTWTDATAFCK